jgi:hypothetical protein
MPNEGSTIKFKNYANQLKVPFVWYADFESFLVPVQGQKRNPYESWTDVLQIHKPASFCLYRVCTNEKYNKMYMYQTTDIISEFLQTLKESVNEAHTILKDVIPLKMSDEEEKYFQNCDICHICKKDAVDKVRDHDHITGKFRGVACNNCNLSFRFRYKFPVFFHNLKGYDSHHIIKQIGDYIKDNNDKLTCIPCNMEKYLSFSWNNINFVDSFQFMASSLDKLANNLKTEDKKHCINYFKQNTDLITKKGIFPYDWFQSVDNFNVDKLPSKQSFYSSLTDDEISDVDYQHAMNVWDSFGCKTFRDYHDLYLKTDVLLLADVFENFRDVCYNDYGLDASHYITAPSLAWDASLKMTGVELELLSDYEKYLFIERGMRGGNSMIAHRYAKADNKYIRNDSVCKPDDSFITYVDANNLYGGAMCQKLPYKNFQWDYNFDINCDVDGDTGYILEVDLDYPTELHDLHNNYPLAPEKLIVNTNWLSDFSKAMKDELLISDDNTSKLVCTLGSKKNYVLHIKNLKLYLSLGMKLTKIHKVLSFQQKSWLEPYISHNNAQRKKAKNDFEKDFYKLMNNSVFGKTMENVRKRVNVELVHNDKRIEKAIAKINYNSHKIFSEDLVGVHTNKTKVVLDKPIYAGMTILDLSKITMYDFHYNVMMKQYEHKDVKLLFTDTDSLCYHIKTQDLYKDMEKNKQHYDLSDYDFKHFLFDPTNKKELCKFKDETNGTPIKEFVGLRSKMYAFTVAEKQKKTCKGVKKYALNKYVKFDDYKDCIFNEARRRQMITMNTIRSSRHELRTIRMNKVGLSSFDNKRYVLDDNINTLAFNHYLISK